MQVFHVKIFLLKGADSCLHFRGQIKTFNHTVFTGKRVKKKKDFGQMKDA